MNLSMQDEMAAQDPLTVGANNIAAPRTRKPRKSAVAKEIEAWNAGFTAGAESRSGGAIFLVLLGAISGAGVTAGGIAIYHAITLLHA